MGKDWFHTYQGEKCSQHEEMSKLSAGRYLGQSQGYICLFSSYSCQIELKFICSYKTPFSKTCMFCAKPNTPSNMVKQCRSEQGRCKTENLEFMPTSANLHNSSLKHYLTSLSTLIPIIIHLNKKKYG